MLVSWISEVMVKMKNSKLMQHILLRNDEVSYKRAKKDIEWKKKVGFLGKVALEAVWYNGKVPGPLPGSMFWCLFQLCFRASYMLSLSLSTEGVKLYNFQSPWAILKALFMLRGRNLAYSKRTNSLCSGERLTGFNLWLHHWLSPN